MKTTRPVVSGRTSNNVTTWRDLKAHLTDEQITELENCEKITSPPGVSSPEQLLAGARARIRENEIQQICAGIPTPPDCTEPSRWLEWEPGVYERTFTSWRRECDGITVEILSHQFSDNRPISREIWWTTEVVDDLGRVRDDLDAKQARTFGVLLIDAADALDRLTGEAPPFM